MADLRGVWAKLDRARQHDAALSKALGDYMNGDNFLIRQEFSEGDGWNVLRLVVKHDPPALELGAIEGDVLTNARGALDYLIWQLVLQEGARPPVRSNAFPIVRDVTKWSSAAGSQLGGVGAQWIDEIRKHQPFHEANPDFHLLSCLDDLNNVFKHRLVPAVVLQSSRMAVPVPVVKGESYDFENPQKDTPLIDGAVLFKVRSAAREELDALGPAELELRVSFGDSGLEWDNSQVLDLVEMVIKSCESAFPK